MIEAERLKLFHEADRRCRPGVAIDGAASAAFLEALSHLMILDRKAVAPWVLAHANAFEVAPNTLAIALERALTVARECEGSEVAIALLDQKLASIRIQ